MNYEKSLRDISTILINSRDVSMFYGLFLAELNKSFVDNFPTAAVSKHKDANVINLIISKDFWREQLPTNSNKMFVIVHELEHVIREHILQASDDLFKERHLANIAMDLSINQCIPFDPPKDKDGKPIGVWMDQFAELNLEKFESSLYYYNRMLDAKKKKEQSKEKGQDSQGKCQKKGNKRGTSGCPGMDTWLDQIEDGTLEDWHSPWKELNNSLKGQEKELFRKEIQELTRKIAEETQKSQGTLPTHIADAIKENFNRKAPVISWKTLFRRFVGSSIDSSVRQTRKRPNFRFEDAPSWKYDYKTRIVVGVDTSGSVSQDELERFFSEINHMYKSGAKVDVCLWDASCEDFYEYKGELTFRRTKCGGTIASCFIDYVNQNVGKQRWTCAITLTDGYIEQEPIASKIPMMWVLTPGGSTEFTHRGPKIKMN